MDHPSDQMVGQTKVKHTNNVDTSLADIKNQKKLVVAGYKRDLYLRRLTSCDGSKDRNVNSGPVITMSQNTKARATNSWVLSLELY